MTNIVVNVTNRFKLYTAGVAMAALVIALLAVTFATASAQGPGVTPPLCGPGKDPDNFPANPAAQKSSGHYALFDAYWLPDSGLGDETKTGTLNNNLCPPAAKHKDVTDPITMRTKEVTTLSETDIDLRSTIIHVTDTHKADVVADDAQAGTTKLSLATYDGVRKALGLLGPNKEKLPLPAGTKVHWLRLEDPDLGTGPSDLVLGFSAGQFDKDYWENEDKDGNRQGEPFQYELEAFRYHGPHASELPQVLTYYEPEKRDKGKSVLVWNSLDTDVNSMPLEVGEYEHLEWVFTHPGTYVLEVHIKGHVRQTKPAGAGSDWKKIDSKESTVTSEVREYTFQVGSLVVNDRPTFGVERSVKENSEGGTAVGAPVRVFTSDNDELEFWLRGTGADKFYATNRDGGAQITVAPGAVLDYEAKQTYDLVLSVTDSKDHENNTERYPTIDDTIVVQVNLVNVPPQVLVDVSKANPSVGETVKVTGSYLELQGYVPSSASWTIRFIDDNSNVTDTRAMTLQANGNGVYDLRGDAAGTKHYQLVCRYQIDREFGPDIHKTLIADFSIDWQ